MKFHTKIQKWESKIAKEFYGIGQIKISRFNFYTTLYNATYLVLPDIIITFDYPFEGCITI